MSGAIRTMKNNQISQTPTPEKSAFPSAQQMQSKNTTVIPFLAEPRIRTKKDKLKRLVKEVASESTTHALPQIFKRENPFIKALWIVCFLGSTGVCAWFISTAMIDYFGYETVSKTYTVLEIPSVFPTVSICNMNPFVTNFSVPFIQQLLINNGLLSLNSSGPVMTLVF